MYMDEPSNDNNGFIVRLLRASTNTICTDKVLGEIGLHCNTIAGDITIIILYTIHPASNVAHTLDFHSDLYST